MVTLLFCSKSTCDFFRLSCCASVSTPLWSSISLITLNLSLKFNVSCRLFYDLYLLRWYLDQLLIFVSAANFSHGNVFHCVIFYIWLRAYLQQHFGSLDVLEVSLKNVLYLPLLISVVFTVVLDWLDVSLGSGIHTASVLCWLTSHIPVCCRSGVTPHWWFVCQTQPQVD